MVTLEFKNLSFNKTEKGISVRFLKYYSCLIGNEMLKEYGKVEAHGNKIAFENIKDEKYAKKIFIRILNKKFIEISSIITKNPTTYIHKNSGIPLIGLRYIGIQDRGTNLLEVKPITGCNAGCTFCSVDEGISSKKTHDFVVEKDYLVEETRRLLDYKNFKGMHIYINVHGEPLLYADLPELIHDLRQHSTVEKATIITNGMLLTPDLMKQLFNSGLTGLHISISGSSPESAKKLMGINSYNLSMVKKKALLAKENDLEVTITPVWLNGVNDDDIEMLIKWCKENNLKIRIQKFCRNKAGRNPVKEISWKEFYDKICNLEKKYDYKLKEELYQLPKTRTYPSPMRLNEIVNVKILCSGRYDTEKICYAKDRLISLPGCVKEKGDIKVKIVHTKDNIFIAKQL